MKKLLLLILLVFITNIGCLAKTDTETLTASKERIENKVVSVDNEILELKVDMLEKHEAWVIAFLGIAIGIASFIFVLLQIYFTKKAEDNVFANLSKIANEDKEAFKEAVRMKSIEIELMSYPIYIIYDTDKKKTMSEDLFKLLCAYRFGNVKKPISYEGAFSERLDQKTIFIFCEDSYNSDECKKLMDMNPAIGVLGLGKYNKENFSLSEGHRCLNYANSFSSVYANLMSLLYYKRYLLSKRN